MVRAHVKQTPEEKKDIQKKKTPTAAKKKNTEAGSWPCKINGCNKVFAREADLKRHQRTTKSHSVPSFACPQCDATFTRTDALRRHQKSRHNGVIIGPSQSDKDNPDADADGIDDAQGSKSPSRAGTPDRTSDEPSSSPSKSSSKDEPSPKAPSISYYRQHTMHPSYGAGGPPLPPPLPPPSMLYDPHYPPPIAMPTSAARLHPWHPVSPPWPLPPAPPASSAPAASPPSTTETAATGGESPAPQAPAESQTPPAPPAPPPPPAFLPPPPPGMMYRMPPPYYPYYSHAPMYPYPPPPEYFAHYGMPMPPYMAPPMPYPLPYPSAPQAASSASGSSSAGSDEEADGEDDEEAERAASPAVDVPNSAIDPLLASSTATDGLHASGDSTQEQENATLEAAKVVEVLLKYQSEKNKENAAVLPTGYMSEGPSARHVDGESSKFPRLEMEPPSNVSVGVQVVDVTVSVFDAESIDDPPMLNADELLTQESLASPPPSS